MAVLPHPLRSWSRRDWLSMCAALTFGSSVQAQAPDRTGRIVTGFLPGAGSDAIARMLAEKMRGRYLPNMIVDNRPGAGGHGRVSDWGAVVTR